ncbi:hypothetical protein HTS61_25115 [Escherichia coli]|nr:hypothetical protein [Escherichia coli]
MKSALGRTPGTADEKLHDLCVGHGATPWIWRPCCRGSGFYSPGEGLAVRRGEQGHWLISSDDGQFFSV